MNTTTLQVPMSKELKSSATAVAKEFGFSSLQEIVRVLLTKISRKEISLEIAETFPDEYVRLSPTAKRRYARMTKDFKSGKNIKSFDNIDEMMKYLNS